MSHNSVVCETHSKEATLFCLCEPKLLYLCSSCLPEHEGHELYPVVQAILFQAIGRNKEELKRRNTLSQSCQSFLDRVMEREAAVQSEAKTLINTVIQSYEMWLEGNHRCFDSCLSTLREETAMLLTRPKYRLSPISQNLLDKLESLNSEDEQRFAQVPEIETLTHLTERCQEACSRTSKMWQMEYEDEVLQVLCARELGPQEKVTVPDDNLKLEARMRQLQADVETKDKERESLEKEIETLNKLGLCQASQLDESRLSLEKNMIRISELEALHKELNIQLETTTHQLQALQADLRAKVQQCVSLERQNEFLNKQCLTQANQLTESQQRFEEALNRKALLEASVQTLNERYASLERERTAVHRQVQSQLEESLKKHSELERQLKKLGQQHEETLHQMRVVRTECGAKAQNCVSLEKEKTELLREVQFHAHHIQETEAFFKKSVAAANEQHSVLESRLKKWGITSDPPTDFQEPDYSTPQSRAALAKFGSYTDQDDELILVKRAPVTDDAGVYIGQWNSRGQRHGYGKYLWKNGNIYEGLWRNGKRTGRGRFIWAMSGTVYVGDFVQNKRGGFGTSYYANGNVYSGAWVNGTKNGVGSFEFGGTSQDNRYIGEYRDDKMDGIGAYFYASGGMYVGSWKSSQRHGKSLQVWADGEMYFGDYEDDDISGTGCHMWPNGDVYRGEWKQWQKNGKGRLTHPGAIEQGTWVDNVLCRKVV